MLLLVSAAWFYLSLHGPVSVPVPQHAADAGGAAMEREHFFRWYLAIAALALTLIGWVSWRVNQRITLNLGKE